MKKQWPIAPLLVGVLMLTVAISLAMANVGDGDIHDGVVMAKGIAPPYWSRGSGSDTFLVIDEGSDTFIVLPVDTGTFATTDVGDNITWEDHSRIDGYFWALALVGALFLAVGLVALAAYSDF